MGVCTRKKLDIDGNETSREGVRLHFFDYSQKEIQSINKYEKKIEEEINRVKKLTGGKSSEWIKRRDKKLLYEHDDIIIMKGVGTEKKKKLNQAGIFEVYQLALCNLSSDYQNVASESGLNIELIKELSDQAREAEHGHPPNEINFLLNENPYSARYGDSWREEIAKVKEMKKYICVTQLVQHIHNKTHDAFKDTKYKDTFLFYHDALSQMTDKKCIEWMRKKDILKRWIRPVIGLNDEITITDNEGNHISSKRYNGRPVGDCAEAMPLDNSLFKDLHTSFDRHCALSYWLPLRDKRRFSKCTPKLILNSITRLWDPGNGVTPKSSRIIQDIDRVLENLLLVVEHDGAIVPGVCDSNGHRAKSKIGRQYWGACKNKRASKLDELGLHPDICNVVRIFF